MSKLYATLKNERGGKKSTSDDTRILVELSYKNKVVGTVGLYAIKDDKVEGYIVLWGNNVLEEQESAKATGKHKHKWYLPHEGSSYAYCRGCEASEDAEHVLK